MLRFSLRIASGVFSLFLVCGLLVTAVAQVSGAQLRGSVATPTGVAVAGAELSILRDTITTLTDSAGRFLLRGVPPGEHVLRVRRIGFRAQYLTINLHAGEQEEVTIALTPGVFELPELAVTARFAKPIEYAWTTKYDDFFRRKLVGLGRYISRQDIDKRAASHTAELLFGMPGVRVYLGMPGLSPDVVTFTRCKQPGSPKVRVFVDGWELQSSLRSPEGVGELLDRIHPLSIEMIEVYTGPARMQAEFRDSCAVIAIWTR